MNELIPTYPPKKRAKQTVYGMFRGEHICARRNKTTDRIDEQECLKIGRGSC